MKIALPLALFCLLTVPCRAAETLPSLFFTESEVALIEEELAQNTQTISVRNAQRIHLESVLYYAPGRWSLWIDGEKWTPETRKASLEILGVGPDEVKMRLSPPRIEAAREVVLRAHQSFDLVANEVVEGP